MQAVIYPITPFDVAKGTTIRFSWHGAQAVKNRCIIRGKDNSKQVYDQTINSFKLEHTIQMEHASLVNGEEYVAYIIVYDRDNNPSDIQSLGQQFLCLKTPTFEFANVTNNQVINSSSLEAQLTYVQENGELLDSWSISLSTHDGTEIDSSGLKYGTENMTHLFARLDNNTEYILRAQGQTVNGMMMDTGYVFFTAVYEIPNIFSEIEAINRPKIGAIQIRSNVRSVQGFLDHGEPEFLEDEYLDLRDNKLTFRGDYEFTDNFSLVLFFYGSKPNQTIMELYGNPTPDDSALISVIHRAVRRQDLDLPVRAGSKAETAYADFELYDTVFELRCTTKNTTSYIRYSRRIPFATPDDRIGVSIFRINGLFHIEAVNFTEE